MPDSLFPEPPDDGPYARQHARARAVAGTDVCAKKHGGNEQSEAAHERVEPHKVNLRERILRFIRMRGQQGATVEEINELCGIRLTTVSARLSELKHMGLIRASGRTRKTTSGSEAAVLVVVEPIQQGAL